VPLMGLIALPSHVTSLRVMVCFLEAIDVVEEVIEEAF